tara:strand:- start:1243 stop:2313 length:1071 start_codon:yes stop_codon:yes gene_type:complete
MPYLGARPTDVPVGNLNNNKNLLINGAMMVNQRGGGAAITSASTYNNNDDSYTLDRWNLVSDGNDIVDVTRSTTAPDGGSPNTIALDVETDDKKFGIVQFLESADSHAAIGQTVSLQFKAKVSNARLTDVRAAVISWDGTADSVTSDVVNAWENASTVPTLATNWTYENTAASLALTTSFATYTIEGIAVDTSSTNNIAVFIWSQTETNNVGDILYITDVQLEVADVAGTYDRKSFAEEWSDCQRYFFSSIGHDVSKSGNTGVGNGYSFFTIADDHGDFLVDHKLAIELRTDPSVTVVNTYPNGAANGVFRNANDGTTEAVSDNSEVSGLHINDTSLDSSHANDLMFGAVIADAEM